jgi:hypothetical protein
VRLNILSGNLSNLNVDTWLTTFSKLVPSTVRIVLTRKHFLIACFLKVSNLMAKYQKQTQVNSSVIVIVKGKHKPLLSISTTHCEIAGLKAHQTQGAARWNFFHYKE